MPQDKLLAAAQGGNPAAQCELATRYARTEGHLEEVNLQRAHRWYKIAAESGYAEAQWLLGSTSWHGVSLANGGGSPQQKRKWLLMAAEQGHLKAQMYFYRKLPNCLEGEALYESQVWEEWTLIAL